MAQQVNRNRKKFSLKAFESELLKCVNDLMETLPSKNIDIFSEEAIEELCIDQQNASDSSTKTQEDGMLNNLEDSGDFSGFLDFTKVEGVHRQIFDVFNNEDTDINSIDEIIDSVEFCPDVSEEFLNDGVSIEGDQDDLSSCQQNYSLTIDKKEPWISSCNFKKNVRVSKNKIVKMKTSINKSSSSKFPRKRNRKKMNLTLKKRSNQAPYTYALYLLRRVCSPYINIENFMSRNLLEIIPKATEIVRNLDNKNYELMEEKSALKQEQVHLLQTLVLLLKDLPVSEENSNSDKKLNSTTLFNSTKKLTRKKKRKKWCVKKRYKWKLESGLAKYPYQTHNFLGFSCSNLSNLDLDGEEATFSGFESSDSRKDSSKLSLFGQNSPMSSGSLPLTYNLQDSIPNLDYVFSPLNLKTENGISCGAQHISHASEQKLKGTSKPCPEKNNILVPVVSLECMPLQTLKSINISKDLVKVCSSISEKPKPRSKSASRPKLSNRRFSEPETFRIMESGRKESSLKMKIVRNKRPCKLGYDKSNSSNVQENNYILAKDKNTNIIQTDRIRRAIKQPVKYAGFQLNILPNGFKREAKQTTDNSWAGFSESEILVSKFPQSSSLSFPGFIKKETTLSPPLNDVKVEQFDSFDERSTAMAVNTFNPSNRNEEPCNSAVKTNPNGMCSNNSPPENSLCSNRNKFPKNKISNFMDASSSQRKEKGKPYGKPKLQRLKERRSTKYSNKTNQIEVRNAQPFPLPKKTLYIERSCSPNVESISNLSKEQEVSIDVVNNSSLDVYKNVHSTIPPGMSAYSYIKYSDPAFKKLPRKRKLNPTRKGILKHFNSMKPKFPANELHTSFPISTTPSFTQPPQQPVLQRVPGLPKLIPYYSLTSANINNALLSKSKQFLPEKVSKIYSPPLSQPSLLSSERLCENINVPISNGMTNQIPSDELHSFPSGSKLPSLISNDFSKESLINGSTGTELNKTKSLTLTKEHICSSCDFSTTKLGVFKRHQLLHSDYSFSQNLLPENEQPSHISPIKDVSSILQDASSNAINVAYSNPFKDTERAQKFRSSMEPEAAMLNNERVTIRSWTRPEKLELIWCYYYSSCSVFPKEGSLHRLRSVLLSRGKVSREKICSNGLYKIVFSVLSSKKIRAQDIYPLKISAEITARKENFNSSSN